MPPSSLDWHRAFAAYPIVIRVWVTRPHGARWLADAPFAVWFDLKGETFRVRQGSAKYMHVGRDLPGGRREPVEMWTADDTRRPAADVVADIIAAARTFTEKANGP